MRAGRVLAAAVVVTGAAAAWLMLRPTTHEALPPAGSLATAESEGSTRKERTLEQEDDGAEVPSPPRMPGGLRGTQPSGDLVVDVDGHFVPGPEALLFFDYYLSASNELSVEALVDLIERGIRARLAPPAGAEAEAFLGRYLDYLAAGDREFRNPGVVDAADLERRIQWVRELRREHFGAELAERLFGDDEVAARVHLERRRLRDDPQLAPEERAARLAELEADYPESVREARARATAPLRHAREEQRLRAEGATQGEIEQLRVERFGPEAADRMRQLDERRAEWNRRLERYRVERDAILAGSSTASEQADAIEALRAQHFTPEEVRRVAALDAAAEQTWAGPAAP